MLPGGKGRYRFGVGVCGPFGDCFFATAIEPGAILPGCTADLWLLPQGEAKVVSQDSCLD